MCMPVVFVCFVYAYNPVRLYNLLTDYRSKTASSLTFSQYTVRSSYYRMRRTYSMWKLQKSAMWTNQSTHWRNFRTLGDTSPTLFQVRWPILTSGTELVYGLRGRPFPQQYLKLGRRPPKK